MRVLFLEKIQNYGDSFPFLNSETFRRASDSDSFCKYAYIKNRRVGRSFLLEQNVPFLILREEALKPLLSLVISAV